MTFKHIKDHLQHFSVGVAGCGGLGSNCAVALTRIGIGKLVIADFDVVQESNLNRQYFFQDQIGEKKVLALKTNLVRINPDIEIVLHDIILDEKNIPGIFASCDVIVEAFDEAETKKMIIETVLTEMPDKHIVSGVGLAGWKGSEGFKVMRSGKLFVCGDFQTEVSDESPPLAPRVAIVANMQANVVLEILMKNYTEKF